MKWILTFGTQPIAFDSLSLAGLIRQPKWGHLKELHKAIKLCETALVSGDPVVTSLGHFHQVRLVFFDCTIHIYFQCRHREVSPTFLKDAMQDRTDLRVVYSGLLGTKLSQ